MLNTLREAFAADGPLAAAVAHYHPRAQQVEMADAVADAIGEREVLVCEAGTGTGKTFAYLVPVLLSGRRTIISTGTRHLQDQLFNRDLPLVRDALRAEASVALLKGRGNYLCLERLDRSQREPEDLFAGADAQLARVVQWAPRTASGDIASCAGVPENSLLWAQLTSTAENCSGRECAFYEQCHVMEARRRAAAADIVVVNHHLLLADMNLREDGFAEVLPAADTIIFDEAHQLPDLAARFFGHSISSRQLGDFARDLAAIEREEPDAPAGLTASGTEIERLAESIRRRLAGAGERMDWEALAQRGEISDWLLSLNEVLGDLAPSLESLGEEAQKAQQVLRRGYALQERVQRFVEDDSEDAVRWLEAGRASFALHRTPIDVSGLFQARMAAYDAAQVYTSATLAVGDSFDYFRARLGIDRARAERWESPFDFTRQSRLFLPGLRVQPNDSQYTRAVCEAAVPVLASSRGRAFMLFTSHRALREASELMARLTRWPLLIQGDAPRAALIDRFRETAGAVLLGTASFWEGVDVRGEALSLVIIDKLPFQAPNEPVLKARVRRIEQQGGNAFRELQLPEAVITLKQGVGRLLRDENDRGVVMIADPRLRGKPYGRVFLASIPPMPVTTELDEVARFFAER